MKNFVSIILSFAPLALANPTPVPTAMPLHKRDVCSQDNCLRALQASSSSALTFCQSYTNGGAPTPTYVPSTCTAPRLSSACECIDNTPVPTYTPAACPTGQVLQNPSFFGPSNAGADIRPWVLARPIGQQSGGCAPVRSYDLAKQGRLWGDPQAINCQFDTRGGIATVGQDVKLCPSTPYTLRLSTACNNETIKGEIGIRFRARLDNTVIIPWQSPCPICEDFSNPNNSPRCREYPYYEDKAVNFTAPATGKGSLYIEFQVPSGLPTQTWAGLVDQIFINSIGDTSEHDPAREFP